jgi:hypothetical protein
MDRDGASSVSSNGIAQLPKPAWTGTNATQKLTLSIDLPEPARADVSYQVYAADLLNGPWTSIATKEGTGSWSGVATVSLGATVNGRRIHSVQDTNTVSSALQKQRYMQLKIAH